jgi:hypothetical protein
MNFTKPLAERDVAEACTKYFRVDRRDLVYLKFILEAYEGLTTLSTVEKDATLVRVSTFPWCAADVDDLIEALRREIPISETALPRDAGEGLIDA